ncbi:hypothetical protein BpHYR1_010952 [Brachionus plicatilis]|uniref:Uncharacterized protein n=1 Tax=Brachionus plicatilis TaxID=10195 RepID=A0A3M7RTV5_BRAPC|nr:hypothetical protein BpHYR1_010952 [Brachionus plicatilis]
MVSMVLVPYGINPNFDIFPRVMVTNLKSCIDHMKKCIEKLETIQGSVYLISAYSYMACLLNEFGDLNERNINVHKFRKLRQQLPLVGYLL